MKILNNNRQFFEVQMSKEDMVEMAIKLLKVSSKAEEVEVWFDDKTGSIKVVPAIGGRKK